MSSKTQNDHLAVDINGSDGNSDTTKVPPRESSESLLERNQTSVTKDPVQEEQIDRRNMIFRQVRSLALMIFIDIGLPLVIYYVAKMYIDPIIALVISGIPPLLHVLFTIIRKRRVDILGCIAVLSFVLSAVLSLISGDIRLALLRDSTTTALVGLMFLVTLIPLETKWMTIRPLTYLIGQQMMSEMPKVEWIDREGEHRQMDRMEWAWEFAPKFRRSCYIMTSLWGFFLMAEFGAKVAMIESPLSIDSINLYGTIIVVVVMVGLTVLNIRMSMRLSKQIKVFAVEWRKEHDFTDRLP
ncbi:hypothetical protein DFQ28_011183 [Apophysomyces sp. BC1034]|nr:hypothetical protein DFQ30_008416 [Apophysomyces sp. BC1015]KAG0182659.1 hypothetical protein DFQ29_002991 [Apophysomyces sp. BC1021]KAG0191708.1 hypothetical protein DFQ28_011183 [Apophysomyces sp. BC1034]